MNDTPILPIIVAEFEKNGRERIRITLDHFAGRDTIDIRCWYSDGADWKPAKQGITTAIRHLSALAEGLAAALDRARELGLVDDG